MNSIEKFNQALENLAELAKKKLASGDADLIGENAKLKQELEATQKEYKTLVTTSEEVINELNNSIGVIDNYLKKQDANNKNT